ncbi:uncharacterized protein LOC131459841 [Solea solea]|uniref:uncharacterized protein LOC131459841 n=1 Tax=Solea solea TaxID=90069 RepID=UPI00272CCA7E|nr:uncharacterized protein LOC131459841 [Solea solea]
MKPTKSTGKKRPWTSRKARDVTHTGLAQALATVNAINELQEKRREEEGLKALIEERKQDLDKLQRCIDERQNERLKSHTSYEMFQKHQEAETACTKAVVEAKTGADQRKKQIKYLKKEKAQLLERKQKLNHQLQKVIVYSHVMEQMAEVTDFSDAEMLADCLERQLDLRESVLQWADERTEQMHENDLEKMDELETEAQTWAETLDQIQKDIARKTDEMVNIQNAIQNIYNIVGGESQKDQNKQLTEIKMFIAVHQDKMQPPKCGSTSKPTQTQSCPVLDL